MGVGQHKQSMFGPIPSCSNHHHPTFILSSYSPSLNSLPMPREKSSKQKPSGTTYNRNPTGNNGIVARKSPLPQLTVTSPGQQLIYRQRKSSRRLQGHTPGATQQRQKTEGNVSGVGKTGIRNFVRRRLQFLHLPLTAIEDSASYNTISKPMESLPPRRTVLPLMRWN